MCGAFTENDRKYVFNKFWKMKTWDEKRGLSMYTKLQKVLDTNFGYKVLSKISKIPYGKTDSLGELHKVIENKDIVNYKYAPINPLTRSGHFLFTKTYCRTAKDLLNLKILVKLLL